MTSLKKIPRILANLKNTEAKFILLTVDEEQRVANYFWIRFLKENAIKIDSSWIIFFMSKVSYFSYIKPQLHVDVFQLRMASLPSCDVVHGCDKQSNDKILLCFDKREPLLPVLGRVSLPTGTPMQSRLRRAEHMLSKYCLSLLFLRNIVHTVHLKD